MLAPPGRRIGDCAYCCQRLLDAQRSREQKRAPEIKPAAADMTARDSCVSVPAYVNMGKIGLPAGLVVSCPDSRRSPMQ